MHGIGFATARRKTAWLRDFVIFLIGQFISVIGAGMQNTARPYLVYLLSGRLLDLA